MRSQIDTALDATEFLTGQWASQPAKIFTKERLGVLSAQKLIALARTYEGIANEKDR